MSLMWWLVVLVVIVAIGAVVWFAVRRARRAGTVLAARVSDRTEP